MFGKNFIPAVLCFRKDETIMPQSLSQLDKNFQIAQDAGQDLRYQPVPSPIFQVDGILHQPVSDAFCRLPLEKLELFSQELQQLAFHTSGAKVRFCTDSPIIALRATLYNGDDMPHMPRTGSSGFDLYVREEHSNGYQYRKSFMPQTSGETLVEGFWETTGAPREILINLPLYNGVRSLEIGVVPTAVLLAPKPIEKKPFVFYGSSITQGGCASRPGNSYSAILSRWFDYDFYNFGFSGNAKGEPAMANLLAEFDASIFFLDYDHNAPTVEHLQKTHEPFFKVLRGAHPQMPVVFITKPDFESNPAENAQRRAIVYATYQNALAAGDKRVWFVDGATLFGKQDRDACTVDGCHPNDLGFYRMAQTLRPVVEEILSQN